jgi:hypothetical protein
MILWKWSHFLLFLSKISLPKNGRRFIRNHQGDGLCSIAPAANIHPKLTREHLVKHERKVIKKPAREQQISSSQEVMRADNIVYNLPR